MVLYRLMLRPVSEEQVVFGVVIVRFITISETMIRHGYTMITAMALTKQSCIREIIWLNLEPLIFVLAAEICLLK
jgi:hypothetical protein